MFSAQEIYILRKENQYLKSHHTRLKLAYLNQKGKVSQSEEESKRLRQENKKLKEEIKTQVTLYNKERQWCKSCHKEVVGIPSLVIPHSRFGLNLIIQVLIFKYVCRMSLEVMVSTLNQTYGVKVSEGGGLME